MSLDKKLEQLKDVPIDVQLKKRIYDNITMPTTKRQQSRRPIIVTVAAVAVVLVLLMLGPMTSTTEHTQGQGIDYMATSYESLENALFPIRPLWYMGLTEIDDAQTIQAFERLLEQPTTAMAYNEPSEPIWKYIYIEQQQQPTLYAITSTQLYNLTAQQIIILPETYSIYNEFIGDSFSMWWIPLCIIILNLLPTIYYKKIGRTQPKLRDAPKKLQTVAYLVMIMFLLGLFVPLYLEQLPQFKGFLYVGLLLFAGVSYVVAQAISKDLLEYRMELLRCSAQIVLIFVLIICM